LSSDDVHLCLDDVDLGRAAAGGDVGTGVIPAGAGACGKLLTREAGKILRGGGFAVFCELEREGAEVASSVAVWPGA
jgi:hypothetical protein